MLRAPSTSIWIDAPIVNRAFHVRVYVNHAVAANDVSQRLQLPVTAADRNHGRASRVIQDLSAVCLRWRGSVQRVTYVNRNANRRIRQGDGDVQCRAGVIEDA